MPRVWHKTCKAEWEITGPMAGSLRGNGVSLNQVSTKGDYFVKLLKLTATAAFALAAATTANATIVTVFDDFDGGIANFNSTVTTAGSTVSTIVLTPGASGNPLDLGDVAITRNNGGGVFVGGAYNLFGAVPSRSTSGGTININPSGTGPGLGAKSSGVTFTFDSGINAFGFEVGDWGTCCQPSDLYIQFGTNTPILVGESNAFGDVFLTNGGAGVFVAALDDTDTFTQVSFWGDGFGEFLVIGGTLRYATLDGGTLPPGVPEPASWAMLIAGFGLTGAAMRRRRTLVAA
jgi:hypothetical protein